MSDTNQQSMPDEREYLERLFKPDACDRLARSERDYQQSHAEYIVPLAKLLNITRTERDSLVEQLEAHRTFVDHFLRWCETVAAEEDNPIHLLVREAEALNPASDPLGLDQADADFAAGKARLASEVFAEIEAEQNQESRP